MKVKGFTLIELMVTIIVAVVLIGVGVPQLTDLYEKQRASAAINRIQSSVLLARNQAQSYGTRVTVCPRSSGKCSGNWSSGFTIFISDTSGNLVEQLRKVEGFNNKDKIYFNHNALTFDANGSANVTAGSFTYCPSNESTNARRLNVSTMGRTEIKTGTFTCK
ncbi:GspH/FimT family pseudopilin [Paraferrimonas haliotis]|uniref:GspH/FimT family pseudopilin n=1 Tax=Paraferrimonas haliotis TaxID=2013866 RepID=UPI0015C6A069|nr:GspH/FimT family pseudopilin [Paraferrimonas haliotis]